MRKITSILTNFESKNLRHFTDFVASPYFNKNKLLLNFVTVLLEYWPNFPEEQLQLEVFQKALNQTNLTQKELTYLFAKALELLTTFITQEEFSKQAYQQEIFALQALSKNPEKEKLSKTVSARLKRSLKRSPSKDQHYFWTKYSLHDALDQEFIISQSRREDSNLQLKSDDLDIFYIYSKLKMACDMTSRNIIIQANYKCHLLKEIRQQIVENSKYLKIKGIQIYWEILQLLENGKAKDFYRLKNSLAVAIKDFEAAEIRLMYDYAQNFCIRQINSGKQNYYREFLDLYKTQLKEKVLFRNGYLEEWDYKNIVTAGVRTKEFEWTENFIQRNKNYLRTELQENAYIYNLANFYYETKSYREALGCLHQVEFTDLSYHLGAKNIQLKSYFELNEFVAFDALIRAYSASVRRAKQLSDYRRKSYLNFLRLAQKMGSCKQRLSYSKTKVLEKRLKEIEDLFKHLEPLANSDWLEMAIEQIKSKI